MTHVQRCSGTLDRMGDIRVIQTAAIKALVTHILCSSDGTAVGPSVCMNVCIDACDNDHSKRTETTVTIFGTYDDLKAPLCACVLRAKRTKVKVMVLDSGWT